jgi:uncharacterized protein (DUF924 family)
VQGGGEDDRRHPSQAARPRPPSRLLQESGAHRELKPVQRQFVYMPFMHSEVLADQDVSGLFE